MPIPEQRDAEQSRKQLATWLTGKVGADGEVTLSELRSPGATGFSNETLIVDAGWSAGGERHEGTYVVRVAPTGYTLFPDATFDTQHRALRLIGEHTSIPVPHVRWLEEDPTVLGAPFFVMDAVAGQAPSDSPPYHVSGWLHDVPPDHRTKVWWGAIDTIAELHQVDWQRLDVAFLERPEKGARGLPQILAYDEDFLASIERTEPMPLARRALVWLVANQPTGGPLVLSWGDARIGNVMDDDACDRVAVLDWEMVTLAPPALDVAWALFVDRHHCEGCGVPRLEGFPSAAETIARYEERTGITLTDLDYFEVFAAFRFTLIMARIYSMLKEWGIVEADSPMVQENNVTRMTERLLDERGI